MDIQIIIYPHNEILPSNTKGWAVGLCDNMDVTQKHAEQKTPHPQEYILYVKF